MDRVVISDEHLVADGEEAADHAVVSFREDERAEDGTDSVVYSKTRFVPGVKGEEYGVVREES
jgi:hypothetical protein